MTRSPAARARRSARPTRRATTACARSAWPPSRARTKGRTQEHLDAFKFLSDFISTEVAKRRADPKDDLITHLAEAEIDGDRLSEREVVLTSATFVMAGVESLSSFMSMLALNLHDYPDARRRIVADPSLLAPAIEESLRFNTSAQRFKRVVARETQLHGKTLRVGIIMQVQREHAHEPACAASLSARPIFI